MSKLSVTINGNEIPEPFVNHFATVLAGYKQTRTGTINPVTKEARRESLIALNQAESLKRAIKENPELPVKVTVPEICEIGIKSGDLFEVAEIALKLVTASQQVTDLRKELKRTVEYVNLRPADESTGTESVNFDSMAELFTA